MICGFDVLVAFDELLLLGWGEGVEGLDVPVGGQEGGGYGQVLGVVGGDVGVFGLDVYRDLEGDGLLRVGETDAG